MKLRIQFTKHGSMKFIGHLDTMRYFQKAIRRSGIDITYTGGYSPHQVMAFAHPLGVGVESESEIVDIEVNSYDLILRDTDPTLTGLSNRERLLAALDAQMSEGFTIRDIRLLPDDAGNAMAFVAGASYEIHGIPEEMYAAVTGVVHDMVEAKEIMILKKTKKSEQLTDIRQGMYDLRFDDGILYMTVDASSAGNIKPDTVVRAICDRMKTNRDSLSLSVLRTEIYGRDSEGRLKPLIDFGTDF